MQAEGRRSMIRKVAPALLLVAVALSSCQNRPKVRTNVDPQADFSGYRTYGWASQVEARSDNPLLHERVRQSIEDQLAVRGMRRADPADIAIAFSIETQQRASIASAASRSLRPERWASGIIGHAATTPRDDVEGSLAIDVYDAGARKLLWHGLVTREMPDKVDQTDIDSTVAAVLASLPVGAPSTPQSGGNAPTP
jgi:hypothetical protein